MPGPRWFDHRLPDFLLPRGLRRPQRPLPLRRPTGHHQRRPWGQRGVAWRPPAMDSLQGRHRHGIQGPNQRAIRVERCSHKVLQTRGSNRGGRLPFLESLVRFHNQGLKNLFLTVSWDIRPRIYQSCMKLKKFKRSLKWVDAQLKLKIPISLPLMPREELWTLVALIQLWYFCVSWSNVQVDVKGLF